MRRLQRLGSAKRSIPLVEQSVARSSCSAPRRCTTSVSALRIVGVADESDDTEKTRRGGSTLTEKTDVAVSPTGPSPASAVMTATPAGWLRNTDLNSSALSPSKD